MDIEKAGMGKKPECGYTRDRLWWTELHTVVDPEAHCEVIHDLLLNKTNSALAIVTRLVNLLDFD